MILEILVILAVCGTIFGLTSLYYGIAVEDPRQIVLGTFLLLASLVSCVFTEDQYTKQLAAIPDAPPGPTAEQVVDAAGATQ